MHPYLLRVSEGAIEDYPNRPTHQVLDLIDIHEVTQERGVLRRPGMSGKQEGVDAEDPCAS